MSTIRAVRVGRSITWHAVDRDRSARRTVCGQPIPWQADWHDWDGDGWVIRRCGTCSRLIDRRPADDDGPAARQARGECLACGLPADTPGPDADGCPLHTWPVGSRRVKA